MPKEPELSINEKSFILEALKQNIRLDGRALDAFRDVELTFGEEYGFVDVRLGKTRFVSSSSGASLLRTLLWIITGAADGCGGEIE